MAVLIDNSQATYYPGNSSLVVDLRERCGTQLRFSTWSAGLRVDRWTDGKWYVERSDPGVSLLASGPNKDRDSPVGAFVRSIPSEALSIARPFDHCQTLVLRLLARSDEAMALGRKIPLLLWLVADAIDRGDLDEDWAIWQLRRGPKQILVMLGARGGSASLQLLRRLRLPFLDDTSLALLRGYLLSRRSPVPSKPARPLRMAS